MRLILLSALCVFFSSLKAQIVNLDPVQRSSAYSNNSNELAEQIKLVSKQNDSAIIQKKYKSYFLFSAGLAEPLGNFASQNYAKSSSGAANTGLAIQFAFHKQFSKNFGFCMAFHRESFFLNEKELANYYQTFFGTGYVAKVDVSQNWSLAGLQAGFYRSFPLNSNRTFCLDPHIMFGLARAKSPGFTLSIDSIVPISGPKPNVTQLSTKSKNLNGTFQFGFGLNYFTKTNWCFTLSVDYLTLFSEAEFDVIKITTGIYTSSKSSWDMEMKYYTVRLGIGKLIGN